MSVPAQSSHHYYECYRIYAGYAERFQMYDAAQGTCPSAPSPSFPKLPPIPFLSFALSPSRPDPPEVDRNTRHHEGYHNDHLSRLGNQGPAQQEQAHAAEDDRGRDPRLVGPLQIGFPHPQYDQPQHGDEVEPVGHHTRERDQRCELADDNISHGDDSVGQHCVDRREPYTRVLVPDDPRDGATQPRFTLEAVDGFIVGRAWHADVAQYRWQEAFLAGSVHEATARESLRIQRADAGSPHHQGEDERANGSKYHRSKFDGNGVGRDDDLLRQHKDIRHTRGEVEEHDHRHGRMNHPAQIPARIQKLADHVIRIIPSVVRPQSRIQRDGPTARIRRRAIKPACVLPLHIRGAIESKPRQRDHDPRDRNPKQRHELEKHEHIAHARAQLRAHAIQRRHACEAQDSHTLIDPSRHVLSIRARGGADDVFAKNNGDDGGGPGAQHKHRAPREQKPNKVPVDLAQVDLAATVQWDGPTQLRIAGRARPGQDARNSPDDERAAVGSGIDADLGGGGEDAGADDEANDEGEAVEVGKGFVFLEGGARAAEVGRVGGGRGAQDGVARCGGGGEREEVRGKVEGRGDGVGSSVWVRARGCGVGRRV